MSSSIVFRRRAASSIGYSAARARLFTGAGPGRNGRPQRVDAARHESAAPETHGILAHAEGLGDARARPDRQGQQERPRPIRLAASRKSGASHELTPPASGACDNGDLPAMIDHTNRSRRCESQTASVGHPAETCLAYLPEDLVEEHIAEKQLIRVLEDWCEPYPGYHLYYPSSRQHAPAFAVVLEALRFRG